MSAPASSSKSSQGPVAHCVDRLSNLPEPLLHLVLSFLPMPEVVRTSLLSKSWRYRWASVPFIHLDYKDFVDAASADDGNNDNYDDDEWEKRMLDLNRWQKFGDHLLLLRDGTLPLHEAQIFICFDFSDKCGTWIRRAIRHKARMLHVYGPRNIDVTFDDRSMFPSQHLKRIRLQTVHLDDRSFRPLNFDFPVLEHLELDYCSVWSAHSMISQSSLKTIRISSCYIYGGLVICAPNLNHLFIVDPAIGGGFLGATNLHSLVTASVSLRSRVPHGNRDKMLDLGILDGLTHATALELHAPLPEPTLERSLQTCLVFSNLTSLVLGEWCTASDFAPLLLILRCSPKLKDLTFKLKMKQHGEFKDADRNPSPPRKESSSGSYPNIERTVIYCGKDDPRVSALVKVLLPIVIPGGQISIKGH